MPTLSNFFTCTTLNLVTTCEGARLLFRVRTVAVSVNSENKKQLSVHNLHLLCTLHKKSFKGTDKVSLNENKSFRKS